MIDHLRAFLDYFRFQQQPGAVVSSTILLNKEILTSAGRIIVLVGAGDEISV